MKATEMSNYIDVEEYDQHEEKHAYYVDMMAEMSSILSKHRGDDAKPCRVLELGAGTGIFTKRLAKIPNVQVVAVEIDVQCFQILKDNMQKYPSVELVNSDSCTYHYQEAEFDYIVSSFADHHIRTKDKQTYLQNVRRNLQPNGLFIVGDEFLPAHDPNNYDAWEAALQAYHYHIIDIALQQGEEKLANLEQDALKSGLEQNGDFKISCKQYEEFLTLTKFTFNCKKIGPLNRDDVGGVYVYWSWFQK
ncbi:class I SAM-dependent methyltransferase [Iningainema tapete]|nr:class I SAM-dependent methyltransferase [Iningainema tapete]